MCPAKGIYDAKSAKELPMSWAHGVDVEYRERSCSVPHNSFSNMGRVKMARLDGTPDRGLKTEMTLAR